MKKKHPDEKNYVGPKNRQAIDAKKEFKRGKIKTKNVFIKSCVKKKSLSQNPKTELYKNRMGQNATKTVKY